MSKMMVRANRAKGKRQGGFALLEVLLAVIVIALATWGVVELFASAKAKNQTTKVLDDLGKIQAAYGNMTNLPSTVVAPFTAANLFQYSGTITADMLDSTGQNFQFPVGTIDYLGLTSNSYKIKLGQLSGSQAREIADQQIGSADVSVASGAAPDTMTASMDKNTINTTITNSGMYGILLCYPAGSLCSDGTPHH